MFDNTLIKMGIKNPKARTFRALIKRHPLSGKRMFVVYYGLHKQTRDEQRKRQNEQKHWNDNLL